MYKDHLQDLVKERTAALTESEARFRVIFEGASFGIVLRDLDGTLLAVNPAFEKILGFSQKEMAQAGWSFLHPEDAPRFLSHFQELTEGKRDFFNIEARAFHRDGRIIWGRARQSRVRGKDDRTWYVLGLIEDITAEKAMEEEIAAYQEQLRDLAAELTMAEEKERRRLAEELHDHISQVLALSQLKLGALKQELADSQVSQSLDEVRGHLSRVIKTTRSLTAELGSRLLNELGLEAGVQWLADKFREQYGLNIEVQCNLGDSLEPVKNTLLFRVARELLINVVKHAQAHKVKISLIENNGELQLLVADDGVGLAEANHGSLDSFGLFSIGERLRSLGGRLDIDSSPGRGARVSITLPVDGLRPKPVS
jgi:PAS domain S-box-containing protein